MSSLLEQVNDVGELIDYYVTFGYAHVDKNNNRLKDCFIHFREVKINTVVTKMRLVFGDQWSMLYEKSTWYRNGISQQERFNLTEIKYEDYLPNARG